MASTVEAPRSQQYVDFDEYIDYQLQKTRGNIKSTDILTAFAFTAVFLLAYLLLFVIADHWLVEGGFSRQTRVFLLGFVSLISAGWLSWKVIWPYLRQVNQLFAAKVIEKSQPELRSTLLNLIDARSAGKEVSPEILAAMEKRAAVSMSHTNVDEAVDRRPLMWACYAILGLVVLFSLYTILTPKKVSASVWRALFPIASVEAPTQTVIENVTPGDTEVIPGTRLEVLADISGEIPEKITLHYSTQDREFVDEPIEMREVPEMPKRYRAEIIGVNGEGIRQSLNYYIQAGDDRSLSYAVTVFQPPTAEIVELHYSYPKYMERESKTLPTGSIDDYEGVTVTFLAEGNMPLRSAMIAFHDDQGTDYRSEAISMSPVNTERTRFRAQWKLNISAKRGTYPRYYTIECKNERGDRDPSPTHWPIRIHPDKPPEVKILNPRESELERPANAVVPLTAAARDDFKVKSLSLWKQLNDQEPVRHRSLFDGSRASLSVDFDWRLNEGWELAAGDVVSYWVQAEDNREPTAGRINTDKQTIRIQPERPEEEVQQQLENDRRPEQKKENPEESPKNEENQNQKSQSPQDAGKGEENPDQKQPMPEDNQPEKNQTGDSGGGESQKSENSDANQGSGKPETKQNGAGESVKNDGSQDDKALESLHRHLNQDQPEPGEKKSDSEQNQTDPNKSNDGGAKDNQANKPEQQPDGTDAKNQDSNTGAQKPGEKPEQKPEGMDPNAKPKEQKPGETPDKENPTGSEKGTDPKPMGDEKSETPKPGAEEKNPKPGVEQKPGESKSPMNNNQPGNPSDTENKPGGADQKPGGGSPSKSNDPKAPNTGTEPGSEDMKPGQPGEGEKSEKPLTGTEQEGDPDKDSEKRDATGNETGKGTAEDDPKNAKPAKNNIERKDPEKPTATQKRNGTPEELPDQEPTKSKDPNKKNSDPAGAKESAKKPGEESKNPDERPEQAPGENPERKPARSKNQPNAGEEDLKGEGRPDGQEAEKPDGGEAGSSKQNKEGTPGGEEKGPGDKTPKPGDKEPSQKPKGGKPSEEKGPGSKTRPTEKTDGAGTKEGTPDADPNQAPTGQKPGESESASGGKGTDGERTEAKRNQRTGQAGPSDLGQGSGDQNPITPEAARAAEEANLEYGREATDLALKKLENELKRGEVNEEWLKEMGWDKADASQFLDRMKDRMDQRDDSTPEALAKKRQFNEWLKRLNKPATKTSRRIGESVKNRGRRDLIDSRTSTPPPELREIYRAYQRGISERSD